MIDIATIQKKLRVRTSLINTILASEEFVKSTENEINSFDESFRTMVLNLKRKFDEMHVSVEPKWKALIQDMENSSKNAKAKMSEYREKHRQILNKWSDQAEVESSTVDQGLEKTRRELNEHLTKLRETLKQKEQQYAQMSITFNNSREKLLETRAEKAVAYNSMMFGSSIPAFDGKLAALEQSFRHEEYTFSQLQADIADLRLQISRQKIEVSKIQTQILSASMLELDSRMELDLELNSLFSANLSICLQLVKKFTSAKQLFNKFKENEYRAYESTKKEWSELLTSDKRTKEILDIQGKLEASKEKTKTLREKLQIIDQSYGGNLGEFIVISSIAVSSQQSSDRFHTTVNVTFNRTGKKEPKTIPVILFNDAESPEANISSIVVAVCSEL